MPRARLRLTIPEAMWVGDLSRRYDANFRILAALTDDDGGGVGLVEVTADALEEVVDEMHEAPSLQGVEVLQRDDRSALVQFQTGAPLLLTAVGDSGVPLELPFDIADGEAIWELTAPRDRIAALGDRLDELGVSYTVESIREQVGDSQLLTDRQASVLTAAVERGYYDTPRGCSLTDLADDLDMAKSTCSEILHRAEERVVKQFVENSAHATATAHPT